MAAKYLSGSFDTSNGWALDLTARASTPDEARRISETLTAGKIGLKQEISNAPDPNVQQLIPVIDSISISHADTDAKVNFTLPQSTVDQLLNEMARQQSGADAGY
jgi:hypothetical protein